MTKPLLIVIALMGAALAALTWNTYRLEGKIEDKNKEIATDKVIIASQKASIENYRSQLSKALNREKEKDAIITENRERSHRLTQNNTQLKQKLKDLSDAKPIVQNYFYERVPDDVIRLLQPARSHIPNGDGIRVPTSEFDDINTGAGHGWQDEWGVDQLLPGSTNGIKAVQFRQEQHEKFC